MCQAMPGALQAHRGGMRLDAEDLADGCRLEVLPGGQPEDLLVTRAQHSKTVEYFLFLDPADHLESHVLSAPRRGSRKPAS